MNPFAGVLDQLKQLQRFIPNQPQQKPYGIASLPGGEVLTNGQYVPSQKTIQQLLQLRDRTLKYSGYTPQTRAYLKTIPITANPRMKASGVYYPTGRNIELNSAMITPKNIGTMRHEFLHALDANANFPKKVNSLTGGPATADSYGFYNKFSKTAPTGHNRIMTRWLSTEFGPDYKAHSRNIDIESFAERGTQGSGVLINPFGHYYENIYAPMSVYNPYESR